MSRKLRPKLRSRLRVAWRAGALSLGTAAVYAAYLPIYLLLVPLPKVRRGWRDTVFRLWSRYVTAVLGARVEVQGRPPSSPFLLVTNHLSYLDIPLIASRVGARFVAKSEVRRWPFVGILCRSAATIFVDRTSRRDVPRVADAIARGVSDGDGVVLFPEGTSTAGEGVTRFRSALLAGVAAAGLPVYHAALSYHCPDPDAPAHLRVCWWGEMTFGSHLLELLAIPTFRATLRFGELPISDSCRKRLALRLREAVAERFVPVLAREADQEAEADEVAAGMANGG